MDTSKSNALLNSQYQLGWICALPIELAASLAMLDQYHGMINGTDPQDTGSYHAGRIQVHEVVMTCLPDGEYGNSAAGVVATNMLRTFSNIKCGLLVGIGGGLPSENADLRLGDIVVSSAEGTSSGVIQFDRGKKTQDHSSVQGEQPIEQFVRKGALNRPSWTLRTALSSFKAFDLSGRSKISDILKDALSNPDLDETFRRPNVNSDCLYLSSYIHSKSPGNDTNCSACDRSQVVKRASRSTNKPRTFYGTILSGNVVIKSAKKRDELISRFRDDRPLCVEMEASGLMNSFPCMVIRGICDYADSHKNDQWHGYAALTAAAAAKNFLFYISKANIDKEKAVEIKDITGLFRAHLDPLHTQIESGFQRIHTGKEKGKLEQDESDLDECHRELHPGISYEGTKRIIANRAAHTCRWILDDVKFISWEQNPLGDLLWISAGPGCGKSVFCKSLVDEILTQDKSLVVCSFFFRATEKENNLSTALCSILYQLFMSQRQLRKHAREPYKRLGSNIKQEPHTLWEILISATSDPAASRTVCVIDALDEASDECRKFLIKKLCCFHMDLNVASAHQTKLKFLVTSRFYDEIEDDFEQLSDSIPKIRLRGEDKHEQISQEIDQLIMVRVDEIARKWNLPVTSKDRLLSELLTMEHRTYLWLRFTMDSINKTFKHSPDPESAMIKRLPKSVDQAYQELLSKIDADVEERARKILLVVTGARRALTIGELCLILEIYEQAESDGPTERFDPSHLERYMRQWCGLFILFDRGRVYLVHQTAKDFLLSRSRTSGRFLGSWRNSMNYLAVERTMAMICVRYLFSETCKSITFTSAMTAWDAFRSPLNVQEVQRKAVSGLHSSTLYVYAALFWSSHLADSSASSEDTVWTDVLHVYHQLIDSRSCNWATVLWEGLSSQLHGCDKYPIFLAIALGHHNLVRLQIGTDGFELEKSDSKGRTPLIFAADLGLHACVELLITLEARLDARSMFGEDALIHAVGAGHTEVVRILLENGANPNSMGCSSHPLVRAAFEGQIDVIKLLLEHGSDVNSQCGYLGSALHTASYHGYDSIVAMLLEAGARIDEEAGIYGNALQAACVSKRIDIVKTLIQHNANVNRIGGLFGSPLLASVNTEEPDRDIVNMLVRSGARAAVALTRAVETPVKFPLEFAPPQGLDDAAVLDAIGRELRNDPINVTCYRVDWIRIHSYFKEHLPSSIFRNLCFNFCEPWRNLDSPGSDVYLSGSKCNATCMIIRQTVRSNGPVHYACEANDVELLKDLLAASALVNVHDDDEIGRLSPLGACLNENEEMLHLLLKSGVNVNAYSRTYGSPLQAVCIQSHLKRFAPTLIAFGADVNIVSNEICPPLHLACRKSDIDLADMLLKKGANVNLEYQGECPLSTAYQYCNIELIRFLLNNGANNLDCDWWKSSRVFEDEFSFNGSFVHALLESIDKRGFADISASKLLKFAVDTNSRTLIEAMAGRGIDVNRTLLDGNTLLHIAVAKGCPEIVRTLIQQGGDPNLVTQDGSALLHVAASRGYLDTVRTLVQQGGDPNAISPLEGSVVQAAVQGMIRNLPHTPIQRFPKQKKLIMEYTTWQSDLDPSRNPRFTYGRVLSILFDAGAKQSLEEPFKIACDMNNGHMADVILSVASQIPTEAELTKTRAIEIALSSEAYMVTDMLMEKHNLLRDHHMEKDLFLSSAIQSSNANMVLVLLKNGADANFEQSFQGPPLYQAALKGDASMVGLLIAASSIINAQVQFTGFSIGPECFYGSSLHAVAKLGNLTAAKLLVAAGANVFVPGQCIATHPLCTAIETAEHFGYTDLAAWLKDTSTEYGGVKRDEARDELDIIRLQIHKIRKRFSYLEKRQCRAKLDELRSRQLLGLQTSPSQQRAQDNSEHIQSWEDSDLEIDWNSEKSEETSN